MRLAQFRVTNFRSVIDSEWVEADEVTALIGVNESGKTNLLLPLWKLNPAREGEIAPTSDYPKSMFADVRANPEAYCFVTADFSTDDFAQELAELAGIPEEQARTVRVKRFFDGQREVEFPEHKPTTRVLSTEIRDLINKGASEIAGLSALKQEEANKAGFVAAIRDVATKISGNELDGSGVKRAAESIAKHIPQTTAKTSSIYPRAQQLVDELQELAKVLSAPPPNSHEGVEEAVLDRLPKFVYYSNYGNLDSEIYLPHVVDNLKRDELGAKEAAKARTLRVLFRFVRLEPQEILELGRDFVPPQGSGRKPSQDEIEQIADKKRERSILLQSAGTKLTGKFKEWWKQGDYRFRFEADGDHFRIWVSDDRRPDEIELESRSTGLQWFLSFYLVFLVESEGEHSDAILLLDEPGLSLHPLAQRDLSAFFDNLAKTNQLLYTTHSPFLVHADRLERARKVYLAADGTTKATPDLRYGSDPGQTGAAYAVYSAINLNVSESLLLGCQPVLVEGTSDQHYLTTIKVLLISGRELSPSRELVFPPTGGTRNTRQIASIVTGRNEDLPVVVLDGDQPGLSIKKELSSSIYVDAKDRILIIDDFTSMERSEVEDLFPIDLIAQAVDRIERRPETAFADVAKSGAPIVGQIEKWATDAGIQLKSGWKVEVAKRVKSQALSMGICKFNVTTIELWKQLFSKFEGAVPASN